MFLAHSLSQPAFRCWLRTPRVDCGLRIAGCGIQGAGAVVSAAIRKLLLAGFGCSLLLAKTSAGAQLSQPPGPSSRKTGLVITEIMYHPASRPDGKNLEFVELYNSNPFYEDLSNYQLSGEISFIFAPGTVLEGRSFLIVARSPTDLRSVYNVPRVLGPYAGNLSNGGGTLELRNPQGAILLAVTFGGDPPWPLAADGAGHSLVLARPSYGEADPAAWSASDAVGGSPGTNDPVTVDPVVVINEFLADTEAPDLDFIELFNTSNQEADISGCSLSDDLALDLFVFPPGTTIPARGFLALDEFILGFALDAGGEMIFFRNSTRTRVLDAVLFGKQAKNISLGRYPDGGPAFRPLAAPTPWAPNSGLFVPDIVINEIMFAPISGDAEDEFIELHNRTTNAVEVGGWKFTDGISFTIPFNTLVPANGYLVVAKNAAHLWTHYPNLTSANTVGNFQGTLADSATRLTLLRTQFSYFTNQDSVMTNVSYAPDDEVTYHPGGRWSRWASGGGSSLELTDSQSDRSLAANWADSDDSGKAPWTTIQATGVLDNGPAFGQGTIISNLQIVLLGEGECLIDNVEVMAGSDGPNLIANSTFESGANGWFFQGSHVRTSLETTEGFNSSQSLHLRASSRGDTGANRIRTALVSPLTQGQPATIRARVRWLRGWPEIVLRVQGNWLEAAGRLSLPPNLGTPGERNSQASSNGPPAIYDVSHAPLLPAANQAAIVSARVHDPNGISSVLLKYRIDPAPNFTMIPMTDNGNNGDTRAGDGIYSATIPAQPGGTLAAFYIQATDNFSRPMASTFPSDAPIRECLVRFGEPVTASGFGAYRLWITAGTLAAWINRPVLSEEPLDGTFIYGNQRVIYNVGCRYAPNPFVQAFNSPLGSLCNYSLTMSKDERFLGPTAISELHVPGNVPGDDPTLQCEQTACWMAGQLGLPASYRRYVNVYVNGLRRGSLMEDAQMPDADFVREWFPSAPEGEVARIQSWIEFDQAGSGFSTFFPATLNQWTTIGGEKKAARYRWNYLLLPWQSTVNDYSGIFALTDIANTPTNSIYLDRMSTAVDVDQWLRTFAFEHALGNFDSFGNRNGQNMYAYKPLADRWKLLPWDLNVALGNGGSDGPGNDNLFQSNSADTGLNKLYNTPVFRRAYWRHLKDIADGPMNSTHVEPMLDARFAAFLAEGLNALAPGATRGLAPSLKAWIATRRNYLLSQLASVSAPFTVGGTYATTNNLVIISGTAPIDVAFILINGSPYPLTWISDVNWTIHFVASPGTATLNVAAQDRMGRTLANSNITVTYSETQPVPPLNPVINEIMYKPAVPGGSYLEIYNPNPAFSFDLSNWSLLELGYRFPLGTILTNQGFVLLAKNRDAFYSTYTSPIPVTGEFSGQLDASGKVLTLSKPGGNPPGNIVNRVRYDAQTPWPTPAAGASLQLIDPTQDNSRVSNWSDGAGATLLTPGSSNPAGSLPAYPPLWLNEVHLNSPASLVADHTGEHDPWIELYNPSGNAVTLDDCFLANNYSNLTQWAFPPDITLNPGQYLVIWADDQPGESTTELHTNFRLSPSGGAVVLSRGSNNQNLLLDYLNYPQLSAQYPYGSFPNGQPFFRSALRSATAGGGNTAPAVFINEWMASNTRTLTNPITGAFDDWFELYNAGPSAMDLSGFYLTDRLSALTQSRLPDGVTVPGEGFLLVWADNSFYPNNPDPVDAHANFALSRGGESIGLANPDGALIDFIAYNRQNDDESEGRFPDGADASIFPKLRKPTPRAPNALPVFVPAPLRLSASRDSATGAISLRWPAAPGQRYRVEYKNDLNAAVWVPLQDTIVADDEMITVKDNFGGGSQRFYRIVLAE